MRHVPVLLHEVIEVLRPAPGQTFVDGTLGDAGHAEAILDATGPNGKYIGFDADPEAILRAKRFLEPFKERVVYVRENFSRMSEMLAAEGVQTVNGVLIDLGWSTPQFAERGRGFSFLKPEEPLDMRYSGEAEKQKTSAKDMVNSLSEEDLMNIFRDYGDESLAREIAAAIVAKRAEKPIETVGDLTEVILQTYRKKLKTDKEIPWVGGMHPATKVFQALRIAVNNEFGVIKQVLPQALNALAPGGRLAVITFHSGEDRIVKHEFKRAEQNGFTLITKKPIVCSEEEGEANPPSRSAKLRVIEKTLV